MIARSIGPGLALAGLLAAGALAAEYPERTIREICEEATRSNQDKAGRPLPLAAHWNAGGVADGFDATYQLGLLTKGRHILPWFGWPPTDRWLEQTWKPGDPRRQKHIDSTLAAYETPIRELARLKLPISFLSTQWESTLTYNKAFFGLPPDQNPNVLSVAGINVYLDGETLYGGAWHLKAWPGTWLKSDGLLGDSWHHVAIVLRDAPAKAEPGHLLLFVDGKQAQSGDAACIGAHPGDICIGWAGTTLYHDGKTGERTDAFAGRLDDVLIFTRALSEAEVKTLATHAAGPDAPRPSQ